MSKILAKVKELASGRAGFRPRCFGSGAQGPNKFNTTPPDKKLTEEKEDSALILDFWTEPSTQTCKMY